MSLKMNKKTILKYQKFAEKLAFKAGQILQDYRERIVIKKSKKDKLDVVTNADLEAERFLIEKIHAKFPNHNIYSEECGKKLRNSHFTWIIDPLDGTREYVRGIPNYTVNLTLEYSGKIIVGTVYRPSTDQIFSGAKGKRAHLNGKSIHVSQEVSLKDSFLYTHLPDYRMSKEKYIHVWQILSNIAYNCYRLRGLCEDILSLCFLAMGACEGYILITEKKRWSPKWWDVASGLLIVEEAGGKVTDIYGQKIKNHDLSKGIVASNAKIHDELLKILST